MSAAEMEQTGNVTIETPQQTQAPTTPAPTTIFEKAKAAAVERSAKPTTEQTLGDVPEWLKDANPDLQAWAQTKGITKKSQGELASMYRELEKFKGVEADKILRKPDWENPEDVASFNAAIGVPKDLSGYQPVPVEFPGGVIESEIMADIALHAELTPRQHQMLAADLAARLTQGVVADQERKAAQEAVEIQAQRKSWGVNAEAKEQAGLRGVEAVAIQPDKLEAIRNRLGDALFNDLFVALGEKLSEAKPPPAGDGGALGALTRERAAARIESMRKQPGFLDKMKSDPRVSQEWMDLNRIAFSD